MITWKCGSAENSKVDQLIKLLRFCLDTTYFTFRDNIYQQKDGCAMGSPCSPLSANAYMEYFEQKALKTAPHPPRIWFRFVDDTFTVIKTVHLEEFTDHINNIDPNIKFTREEEEDGQLPFLDTHISRREDGSLKVKVYRKPTHTDQYLHFDSHHPLEHKLSVVRTLYDRADSIVTDPEDKSEELDHVKGALRNCGYKDWALFRGKPKQKSEAAKPEQEGQDTTKRRVFTTLPYVSGFSEKLRRAFTSAGVTTTFKPQGSLRQSLVAPKDKTAKEKLSGVVYSVDCAGCDSHYIGESGRKLEKRITEHKSTAASSKSAIKEHVGASGHKIDWDNIKVLDREPKDFPRRVREAIHIRKETPRLNRDKGLDLDPVWDNLLFPKKGRGRTQQQ